MNFDDTPVKSVVIALPTLAETGPVVDRIAAQHVLEDYHEKISDETQRRQKQDLTLFSAYLREAHIQTGDFYEDLNAWTGVSAGHVKGFLRWMVEEGYAIASINVRLATVKKYC